MMKASESASSMENESTEPGSELKETHENTRVPCPQGGHQMRLDLVLVSSTLDQHCIYCSSGTLSILMVRFRHISTTPSAANCGKSAGLRSRAIATCQLVSPSGQIQL